MDAFDDAAASIADSLGRDLSYCPLNRPCVTVRGVIAHGVSQLDEFGRVVDRRSELSIAKAGLPFTAANGDRVIDGEDQYIVASIIDDDGAMLTVGLRRA